MGWGHGIVDGRHVGYNIRATCDYPKCKTKIDRGLAYACGDAHGATDKSCGKYFCYEHLVMTPEGQLCPDCFSAWLKTPAGVAHQKRCDEILAGAEGRLR
jgi:hypothetical protein